MILLIGVLVFVFYQFNAPPIVFNAVEEAKAKQNAQFQTLETDFARKHAEKSQLATEFLNNRNEETKQKFLSANDELKKTRNEAVDYIKKTSNEGFNDVNYVFPTFVISNMPMGVIGLIIAAIFAAAMSSIAAELNSLATATTIDFYRRLYAPDASDEKTVRVGKLATLGWGLFACVVAIYATNLGSLIEVVNKFGSFFYGSLLGVFVLAIVVKRARARGAFFGLLFGIASVWIASLYTNIEFLWFNVIGCLVTVLAGYLISLTVNKDSK